MLIDVLFLALMVFAIFKGFSRGFVVALFSVFAVIAGVAAAIKLSAVTAAYLGKNIHVAAGWLPFLAFFVVFILVVLAVRAGAAIIEKTMDLALLGWLNKLAGIILYALLYTTLLSIFIFYASQMHIIGTQTVQQSVVWPFIEPFGPKAMEWLGKLVPFFKGMFNELQAFFGSVEGKLQ